MTELARLVQEAETAFSQAADSAALENAKARFLGKNGALTEQLKALGQADAETKKSLGAAINGVKQQIESLLAQRRMAIAESELNRRLAAEGIDVSQDGRGLGVGAIHPVIRTWRRVEELFQSIGFDVADGPEIETDWMNFTALNNPENHPARSMQDTFYLEKKDETGLPLLLRTHTSPMQVRYARTHKPPIKVIAPGRTYRVDSDATHSPMFADLKGVYTDFLQRFYETDQLQVRFRPSFFPFTEPSAEIDMRFESGPLKGRWLEIAGSGQVHPKVVRHFGLDPERYIGFAFGTGLERMTMLRYGIADLRLFFDNDLRFLRQFA
jgi:phenylalanyl-tRNA synthetase alpha chain